MAKRRRSGVQRHRASMVTLDSQGREAVMPLSRAQEKKLEELVPLSKLLQGRDIPIQAVLDAIASGQLAAVGDVDPLVRLRDFGEWSLEQHRQGQRMIQQAMTRRA